MRAPGVTPEDTAGSKVKPGERAMDLQRIEGIDRTTGIVAASPGQQGRDQVLINVYQQNEGIAYDLFDRQPGVIISSHKVRKKRRQKNPRLRMKPGIDRIGVTISILLP